MIDTKNLRTLADAARIKTSARLLNDVVSEKFPIGQTDCQQEIAMIPPSVWVKVKKHSAEILRAAIAAEGKQMTTIKTWRERLEPITTRTRAVNKAEVAMQAEIDELRAALKLSKDECDIIAELNHGQWLALENIRLLAARQRNEDWAKHVLRFCTEAGSSATVLRAQPQETT